MHFKLKIAAKQHGCQLKPQSSYSALIPAFSQLSRLKSSVGNIVLHLKKKELEQTNTLYITRSHWLLLAENLNQVY